MGVLPLALAGLALFILSTKNDVKRKDREKEEALQLEGEIKRETFLALTAAEVEDDFCPHKVVCDNIVACDLTDKIYRAAWEAGIAPYAFLQNMSFYGDPEVAESEARGRKVYRQERRHSEELDGCVYNYPKSADGKEQREKPPRKEASKGEEEGERAWCEHCGSALLSYKSKCYCYKRRHPLADRRRQLS